MAAEKLRSATRVQLLPHTNLFESLTCDAGASVPVDQLDNMGIPSSASITDATSIRHLARLLENGGFERVFSSYPRTTSSMTVVVYENDKTVGSFEMNGDTVLVPGFGVFRCKQQAQKICHELRRILPYGQKIENAMGRCRNLSLAATTLQVYVLGRNHPISYDRDKWCDAILKFASTHVDETGASFQRQSDPLFDVEASVQMAREYATEVEKVLAPDSDGRRQCPMALNSQYRQDAPGDAILIFETDPGWNKVGGPEMLSSHLSEPDGCFVYLKDHGVRFITREQVTQIKHLAQAAREEGQLLEFRYSTFLKVLDSGGDK
ncbi:MAG: hypothetical protein RBS72_18150 [Sedimentisphaerales bacterium]|nr:hypothetical protein [Sedimentisphaerales bacterium]HNY78470.1 hypothetical protein [Sedimentisphaerales bacterium]HOC63670.1 hypothetical protein [Sedimentisphaerales bacterium]HOH64391.1 hypothetical protein [Sedimentisphaerales bacterium]HQA89658.1 hypothetical protein [Sedimentisphaerales bacterium]